MLLPLCNNYSLELNSHRDDQFQVHPGNSPLPRFTSYHLPLTSHQSLTTVPGQIYLQYANVIQRFVFFYAADMNAIVALLAFCCSSSCCCSCGCFCE